MLRSDLVLKIIKIIDQQYSTKIKISNTKVSSIFINCSNSSLKCIVHTAYLFSNSTSTDSYIQFI